MRSFVRFRAGAGMFMAAVESVAEVAGASGLQPLPCSQPHVAGLLDRGGEIITVLSVLESQAPYVVVMESREGTFGLLVSEVLGVVSVEESELGGPPLGQEMDFVTGTLRTEAGPQLLLDANVLWARLAAGAGRVALQGGLHDYGR